MSRVPPFLRRLFLGGTIAAAVLLVAFGYFCYHIVTRSFPQTEGSVSGIDVSAPVTIYRDAYGIPHVMAGNERDCFIALGYLHAQDRLFQMDIARRAGEGRLSEIFGTTTITVDAMFRTMGIARAAERVVAALPQSTRQALEDYSRGINAFIAQHRSTMPVEFDMLNYKPEEWKPVHSVILLRLMAWELNFGWWMDVAAQDVINRVGPRMAMDLFAPWPADAPTILRDEHVPHRAHPGLPERDSAKPKPATASTSGFRSMMAADRTLHELLGAPHLQTGSNAWALAPSRTIRGKPILCNDPHLVITTPSRFYQVHLNAGTANLAGYTIPGLPFVLIGRNNAVAWGLTNAMLDDCDFVVEKIDSSANTKYISHGAWKDMRVRMDSIHVKDTLDVVINIYETDHGPIISAVHPFTHSEIVFDTILPPNKQSIFAGAAIAMHWTGHETTDECTALLKIGRARSSRELVEGISGVGVPAQNFIYADTSGNIGYALAGRIPMREVPVPGLSLPVSGAQDNLIWTSSLPWGAMPRFLNPRSGVIASANNRISADMTLYFGNLWEPPSRIERITDLLESHGRMGVEEMKRFQNDVISPHALDATRYILAAFPDSASQQPLVKQAVTYLANWDGSMAKEEIAASVFNVWLVHMFEALWKQRLGTPVYEQYVLMEGTAYRALTALLRTPQSDWFDEPSTPQREGRDEMIRRCLIEGLQDLTARFQSTEMKRWQWGEMHHMTFKHTLGKIKPLDKVLNIGPFPAAGSLTTINNAQFSFVHAYESSLGPSMRMICDLSTKRIESVVTGGVSGQPFSPHYSDQTPLWRNGGYIQITMDPAEIPQAGWTKLVLEK